MDFDGSQYIGLGNPTELQITGQLSISLWFKTSTSLGLRLVSKDDGSSNRCYGAYISAGQLGFFIFKNNVFSSVLSNTSNSNDNNWHNAVFINNGTSLSIYIDGVLRTSTNTAGGTIDNDVVNFEIGRKQDNTQYFNGKIDAVSIFNYALSSSQITTLYGSSSTGIGNPMSLSPKPVAYYPLGDQDAFNGSNYLVPNSSLKDYVFDFDNTGGSPNDVITAPNILPASSDFTISFWVNPDSSQATYATTTLFGNSANGENIQIISRFGNGYFYVGNGASAYISQSNAVQANVWTLITVTYDNTASVLTAYLNGGENTYTSSSGITLPSQSFGNILQIGRGATNVNTTYFNGEISNFQVFNTLLSSTEVTTLYNYGSPIQTLANIPQNSNLQGWWKLDASDTYDSSTGNWTIEDSSSNSNDGTSSGMTQANLVQSDLSFTSGYSPYALDFDGTNDYIQIPNLSTINTSGNVSISFWMKTSNTTTTQSLVRLQGSTIGFYMYSDGLVRMYGSSTGRLDSSIASNDGEWHLVVGVYGTSAQKLYIDNVVTASDVGFQGTIGTTGGAIGSRYFSSANTLFYGQISNCSVWNTALTSAQVSEIYSEGIPQNLLNHSAASSLVSWWQLGSNSSFNTNWTVLDEKGSNNGTSVNMGEDAIVDGVGSYANGVGTSGLEVIGSAPFSDANSLSVNMDVLDRVTDTPS